MTGSEVGDDRLSIPNPSTSRRFSLTCAAIASGRLRDVGRRPARPRHLEVVLVRAQHHNHGAVAGAGLLRLGVFEQLDLELLHIATDPGWERQGVGAAMVEWVQAQHPGDPIEAETDGDAVGFYRAIGFGIASRGEMYPGIERFRVVSESQPASDAHQAV